MKRRKVYPEHLCLSCIRTTTNKNYCGICLKIATNTRVYMGHDPLSITADVVGAYRPSNLTNKGEER